MSIPKFQEQGRTYHADRCRPLVNAVETGKVRLAGYARGGYPGTPLQKTVLPQMCSVGMWDARGPQDWGLDWHRNEGIELTWLETGRLPFRTGTDEYLLQPGALTITRPWQSHCVGDPNIRAGRLHWVILDVGVRRPHQSWHWPGWLVLSPGDLRELTDLLRHNEQPVWKAGKDVGECFRRISACVKNGSPGSQASRLTLLVNELFMDLLGMMRDSDIPLDRSLSTTQRTVELFLEDLHNNRDMQREPWTVASMAGQCGLGSTRFIYYCRWISNLSPIPFLNQCRIEQAVELLQSSAGSSITDVAFQCGFSTSQYFASVFKKIHGISPKEFRNLHRE